jgi:hypothetical protein
MKFEEYLMKHLLVPGSHLLWEINLQSKFLSNLRTLWLQNKNLDKELGDEN